MIVIRSITDNDREQVIAIYTEVYLATQEEIEQLMESKSILVYDDGVIKGFAHYHLWENQCYLELGVDSKFDIEAIGKALWQALYGILVENGIVNVRTFHIQEEPRWKTLMDSIGFEYAYSVYRLLHDAICDDTCTLTIQQYTDDHFEEKSIQESNAFEILRRENGITPYNWYAAAGEDARTYIRNICKDNAPFINLYFYDGKMVGASQVKDAEVDLLYTVITEQGKGYGHEILKDVIRRGQSQGDGKVYLNAIAQNERAIRLYLSQGFKKLQVQDCRLRHLS